MEVKATVKKLFEVCRKFEQETDWDKYISAVESGKTKWMGMYIYLLLQKLRKFDQNKSVLKILVRNIKKEINIFVIWSNSDKYIIYNNFVIEIVGT